MQELANFPKRRPRKGQAVIFTIFFLSDSSIYWYYEFFIMLRSMYYYEYFENCFPISSFRLCYSFSKSKLFIININVFVMFYRIVSLRSRKNVIGHYFWDSSISLLKSHLKTLRLKYSIRREEKTEMEDYFKGLNI